MMKRPSMERCAPFLAGIIVTAGSRNGSDGANALDGDLHLDFDGTNVRCRFNTATSEEVLDKVFTQKLEVDWTCQDTASGR